MHIFGSPGAPSLGRLLFRPPRRSRRGANLDIHDLIPNMKELSASQMLGKEVGNIFMSRNKGDADLHVLDAFANEVMPTLDMLDTTMMLGVISDIASSRVVYAKSDRKRIVRELIKLLKELTKI
jgi:hypothetical protein